jgi:formate dehydrogenase subunit gamma
VVGATSDDALVERFCKTTRWFHWTFALSFLSLAVTGGVLFLREELGLDVDAAASWAGAHEIAAVVFMTAPWLVVASGDTRCWLEDMSAIARFSRRDFDWLVAQAAPWRKLALPDQDKLNAGQKINSFLIICISAVLVGSGLQLWYQPGAFGALLLHLLAFAVWLPAFAGHVFLAVINPGTRPALRGMVFGVVRRSWAEHHHARWVDSLGKR